MFRHVGNMKLHVSYLLEIRYVETYQSSDASYLAFSHRDKKKKGRLFILGLVRCARFGSVQGQDHLHDRGAVHNCTVRVAFRVADLFRTQIMFGGFPLAGQVSLELQSGF